MLSRRIMLALVFLGLATSLIASAPASAAPPTITRVSGSVLYGETGGGKTLRGAYAAYKIENTTGAAIPNAWAKIDGFAGPVISLAPNEDGLFPIGALADGASTTVYFYLQMADGMETVAPEAHTIHLFGGKPGAGGIDLGTTGFTATNQNSISAAANKIDATGNSISTTTPSVGGTFSVTVSGHTGSIGAGNKMMFTGASDVAWPADSFQLTAMSVTLLGAGCPGAGENCGTFVDTPLIPSAALLDSGDTHYTVTYTYRSMKPTAAATGLTPSGHISSGAQEKHTNSGTFGNVGPIQPVANNLSVTVSASPTTVPTTGGNTTVTMTLVNSGANAAQIDSFVIDHSGGPTAVAASSTYNGSAIADPFVSGNSLIWSYPFTVPAGTSRVLEATIAFPAGDATYVLDLTALATDFEIHSSEDGPTVPATVTVNVGTPPPTASFSSSPPNPSNDDDATFNIDSDQLGSTFECKLDGAAVFTVCSAIQSYSSLAAGSHTLLARATNVNGTGPAASFTWVIDLTAPSVSILTGPAASSTVPSASAALTFSSADGTATFECDLDGGGFAACLTPASYAGLAEGSHTFSVRAVDPATNVSAAATRTWSVDTTAPGVTIDSGPLAASTVASTSATLGFSSPDGTATFECDLDGGGFGACTSAKAYAALAQGSHTFSVRAADPLGNTSAAVTRTWSVDTVAPGISIDSGPVEASTVASASATLGFSSPDATATFECDLDGAGFAACTSTKAYAGLANGSHTFSVRAADPLGNTSAAATRTWTVAVVAPDTTAPDVSINSGPVEASTVATDAATLGFSSTDATATFECDLDGGGFAACTSPKAYAGLANGSHTFSVRASDAAANTSAAATRTWTVAVIAPDTTAPDVSIDSGPAEGATVASASATLGFSSTDATATFECKLDGGGFAACTSPEAFTGLADGLHLFSVRASDAAANVSAVATRSWTIDTLVPAPPAAPAQPAPAAPPAVEILAAPPALSPSKDASFSFSSSTASSYLCSLDGASYTACASGIDFVGLRSGAHSFQVLAVAPDGSQSVIASHNWVVGAPKIEVVLQNPVAPVQVGERYKVTLLVSNEGTAPADAVSVFVSVPDAKKATLIGFTLDPAANASGATTSCVAVSGGFNCQVANLPVGASAQIVFSFQARTVAIGSMGVMTTVPGGEAVKTVQAKTRYTRCTIRGTMGDDRLVGTLGDDVICALAGDDRIFGLSGNDLILAGNDDDYVLAGTGDDLVYGIGGNDRIHGGAGNDRLYAGTENDQVFGDSGNDTIWGWHGDDVIYGGEGHDLLLGDDGNDHLYGEEGKDVIYGDLGSDLLNGGDGDDDLRAKDDERDLLFGRGGHDRAMVDRHLDESDVEKRVFELWALQI